MEPILLIAATSMELDRLIENLAGCTSRSIGSIQAQAGFLGDQAVIVTATGMGKVNTAISLTALLEQVKPALVVSTGCAGAFTGRGLGIGDLALSSGTVYGDEGVLTPGGWEALELIGIPLLRKGEACYFNEYPVCPEAVAKARAVAGRLNVPLAFGRSVTVSTCSGTVGRGTELRDRFGAVTENMEGAAAAHVALRYGVPFMELRGISNLVEDRDPSRWDIALAIQNAQDFLVEFARSFPGTP